MVATQSVEVDQADSHCLGGALSFAQNPQCRSI